MRLTKFDEIGTVYFMSGKARSEIYLFCFNVKIGTII